MLKRHEWRRVLHRANGFDTYLRMLRIPWVKFDQYFDLKLHVSPLCLKGTSQSAAHATLYQLCVRDQSNLVWCNVFHRIAWVRILYHCGLRWWAQRASICDKVSDGQRRHQTMRSWDEFGWSPCCIGMTKDGKTPTRDNIRKFYLQYLQVSTWVCTPWRSS